MDSLDNFIKKYTGVGIDTDGAFGNQCMDLMHKYCQEVLGLADLRILAQPNAKSVYLNFNNVFGHELFEKIDNTPTGVPLKGDIVFYNWGTDGHVDIFVQGDANSFRSFSQNFPTGSKSAVVNHPNYNGVLGWLRYKKPEPMATITQKELDAIRSDRDRNRSLHQDSLKKIEVLLAKVDLLSKRPESCPPQRSYEPEVKQIIEILNKIS